MSRERWGTFSVRDHTFPNPFAADVLMYDRLVIPYPPEDKRGLWISENWDPDKLDSFLNVLRWDASDPKRHAIKVSWDDTAQFFYRQNRAAISGAVNQDANFAMTARTLAIDLLPPAPEGIIPVAVVANYPTITQAENDWIPNNDLERREKLTLALAHEFLVPDPAGKTELELLKEAVDLADDDDFRTKRARMYQWQSDAIRDGLSDSQAIAEMSQYIYEYGEATRKAVTKVYKKFVFTLIPIGLSVIDGISAMHGSAFAGALTPIAGTGAIASLVNFWIFDRQPVVPSADNQAAAMLYTAQEQLGWRHLDKTQYESLRGK